MKYTKTLQQVITYLSFHWIALVAASGLLVGCASVNPEPFVKYRNAVQEAQIGIDAAMSVNYTWTRSGFIDDFSSDSKSLFTQIMIQPGDGYDWSIPSSPVYLSVKKTRSELAQLNAAFTDYAALISKLAGGDLVSKATFDQMAKDLNANTTDAAKALQLDASPQGIALFSTAASEAARLYIENQRQGDLKRVIEHNQKNVQDYSDRCVVLLNIIRGSVKTYYADRSNFIRKSWDSTAGEKRKYNTEAILNLNDQYADTMGVLQELVTTYKALPAAHADLAKAIETPDFDVAGIQSLYASAKRLQQLYGDLIKTTEKEVKAK